MTIQFRKIVIGVDFSDASLAGARWVANHLAPDAELLLVHVVPVPGPLAYLHGYIAPTVEQRSIPFPHLHTALREFGDLLGPGRVRVGIRMGVPWSALARVATEVKADLICVGRGQKQQGSSRFGATTPHRLLGISPIPVLVIPQGVVAKPGRVLMALSGRPGGEAVIAVADQLAAGWDSPLEAIHVIENDVHPASRTSIAPANFVHSTGKRRPEIERRIGIDALDEEALCALAGEWMASTISDAGAMVSGEPIIRIGDSGQELITIARERRDPSVIVMGRVAESLPMASERAQYRCGSTTRMVLWAAPGPVFVLPLETAVTYTLPFGARGAALPFAREWHPTGTLARVVE